MAAPWQMIPKVIDDPLLKNTFLASAQLSPFSGENDHPLLICSSLSTKHHPGLIRDHNEATWKDGTIYFNHPVHMKNIPHGLDSLLSAVFKFPSQR